MTTNSLLLVMDAAALSPGVRTALLCLLGLLLVILGMVVFFALVLRRHTAAPVAARPGRPALPERPAPAAPAAALLAIADAKACPSCRREFEGALRYCPHDGGDLVPMSVYEATRGQELAPDTLGTDPAGSTAKICPRCRRRYDFAARFCGRDGAALAMIN